MSAAPTEMLKKSKAGRVKAEDTYTKLRIYTGRRRFLAVAFGGFYVLLFSFVATGIATKAPWPVTALPILVAGVVFLFVPAGEDWEYRPWQSNPRQYEKHQIQRNG